MSMKIRNNAGEVMDMNLKPACQTMDGNNGRPAEMQSSRPSRVSALWQCDKRLEGALFVLNVLNPASLIHHTSSL